MSTHNPLSLDFLSNKPAKAATILQRLPERQAADYLNDIPTRILVPVIDQMESWPAARILEQLVITQHAAVISRLKFQSAAALLRLHQRERRQQLYENLPHHLVRALRRSLAYGENSVGACVDTTVATFSDTLQVGECLQLIQKMPAPAGTVLTVTDNLRHILGVVSLDRLLISHDRSSLGELVDSTVTPLDAQMSLSVAKDAADWERYSLLPVRASGHYLGVVSRENLMAAERRLRPEPPQFATDSLAAHLVRAMFVTLGGLLALFSVDVPQPNARDNGHDREH